MERMMMKLSTLILIVLFVGVIVSDSVAQYVDWTRTYGGADDDIAWSVQHTTDNGYIIAGQTRDGYGSESDSVFSSRIKFYLVKTDSLGDTLWTKTYGNPYYNVAYSVQQTSDGGYILAGYTSPSLSGRSEHPYIIKTDANGDVIWTDIYDARNGYAGYSVEQASDGGYIVVASYCGPISLPGSRPILLLKYDTSGNFEWEELISISWYYLFGRSIQSAITGGYIIAGYSYYGYPPPSTDETDPRIFIVKVSESGHTQWSGFHGSGQAYSIESCYDGGYIVAGYKRTNENMDGYLLKINIMGDSVWATHCYSDGVLYSVDNYNDTCYTATGYVESDDKDLYLVSTDNWGNIEWDTTFGGSSDDVGHCVQQTGIDVYIVAGYTESYGAGNSDFYVIKTDEIPMYDIRCNVDIITQSVPAEDGDIIFDLEVENIGSGTFLPLYAELYPVVGDCATGTKYDFDIYKYLSSDWLLPGEIFYGNYSYHIDSVGGTITDAAIEIAVGDAYENYKCSCCDEFRFYRPWGRGGDGDSWGGDGEWSERDGETALPTITALNQNYPNPFNATTNISFDLAHEGDVNLSVYNLQGQKVESLINDRISAGNYNIRWDASRYSSGVYYYKLTTEDKTFTKRMTLLK